LNCYLFFDKYIGLGGGLAGVRVRGSYFDVGFRPMSKVKKVGESKGIKKKRARLN